MTTVFISHSTRDSDFAKRMLKPLLERRGIATWFSDQDIPSAVDWERKLRRALSDSQWYVVVLSPDAVSSEWVQAEVHWALEKRKGRVIPIMLRDCDPADLHLKLLRIQYIDFRTDPNAGAAQLLELLRQEPFEEPPSQEPQESEDEKTVIVAARETRLRFSVVTGPQCGSAFDFRIRRDCMIGRAREADVRILDDRVSRRHVKLSVASREHSKQLLITDLDSANGTYVNDYRIVAPQAISVGDIVGLGATRLRLESIDCQGT